MIERMTDEDFADWMLYVEECANEPYADLALVKLAEALGAERKCVSTLQHINQVLRDQLDDYARLMREWAKWTCCKDEMPSNNDDVLLCWILDNEVDAWTEIEANKGSYAHYWLDIHPNSHHLLWWRKLVAGLDYPNE